MGVGDVLGGVGSIITGGMDLFGSGGGDDTPEQQIDPRMSIFIPLMQEMQSKYSQLYNDYYWPIEEDIAKYYQQDLSAQRPYSERMRDYQLGRGDELIGLAQETNPLLDENKKSLIRRLTEGEDVLADRYRGQASNDIAAAYNQQRTQLQDNMNRAGINPNSGAFASNNLNMAQSEALAQAAGRTSASRLAEDTSLERMGQALSLYTNPTMQYNVGSAPAPGLSMPNVMGIQGYNPSTYGDYTTQNQQVASGIGGIASGLGTLGDSTGLSNWLGGLFK